MVELIICFLVKIVFGVIKRNKSCIFLFILYNLGVFCDFINLFIVIV